eukprot:g3.t1
MMDREKDLQRRCILFRNGFAQRKHADIFLLLSECRAFLDDEQNRGPLSLPFAKSLLLLLRRYQEDVAATLNNNDGDGALTVMQEKLMVTSFEEACGVLRRLLHRAGGAATSASTQQPSSKEQLFHVFLTQEHLDGWLALIGPILAGLAGSSSPAKVKVQPWTKLLRTLLATARDVAAECAKAVTEAESASLQQEGVLEPETEIYGPALESCLKQWSRDCFNGFVAVGESALREDVVGVADLKAWLSESSAVLATWFSNEQALRMQVASGLTVAATRLRADFGPAEAEAAWDWCLAGIQNTETIGVNGGESVSTLLEFYRESFLHNLVLHASTELQRRLDESMLLFMSAPATAASIEALFPDNLELEESGVDSGQGQGHRGDSCICDEPLLQIIEAFPVNDAYPMLVRETTEGYTQLQAARLWLLLQEGAQETDGASTGRIRALKAALQSLLPSPESRAKFAQSLLRDLSPATDDGLEVAEKAASSILDLSHALTHWRDCVLSRDFADLTRDSRAPSSSSGSANAKFASSIDVFRGRFTKTAAEQDVRVQRYNELARDAFVKDVLILSRLRENPHVDTPQGYFVEEVRLEKRKNVGDSKTADEEAVEEEAVLGLLAQVARAIAYAHASGVLLCRFTADSVCVIEANEGGVPRALLHSCALVDARPVAVHSGGETLRAELDVYAPGCLKASSSQVRASDVAMAKMTSSDVLLEYVAPEVIGIAHGMIQGGLCSMHSDWFAFGALVAKAILSPGDMDALSLSGLERHPVTKLLTFPAQVVSTNSSASRRGRPARNGLDVPMAQVYALDLTQTLLAEAPAMRLSLLPGGQVLAHPGFELATARPTISPALCPTAKRRVPEQLASSEDDNDSADADFPSPFREVFEQLSFLREQYRYVCSKEPLLFQRKKVFQQILHSNLQEWQSDILLGEWRTLLEGESGVDGGGLRREIFHLFFQQMFQQKDFVSRHVEDEADPDRERTYRWMLAQLGTTAGSACAHTTAGYGYGYRYNRPCDLEREQTLPCKLVDDVFADLLDPRAHFWLRSECRAHDDADGALYRLPQNMLDWVILWDIYLVYVGDDRRRWDAYAALREGLTLSGRFARLFSDAPFHGSGATFLSAFFAGGQDKDEQMDGTLSTSYSGGKRLLANVEFRPEHGYEKQKTYFKEIIEQQFSAAERARFLTFAVSLSRLPRSGRFPGGQKLSVRFLGGDDQEMLPAAHTCTWTLDMPAYDTHERMLRKLRQAIEGAALPFAVS